MRKRGVDRQDARCDLAAQQILNGGLHPLIRNVDILNPGRTRELNAREMKRRSSAWRSIGRLLRIGPTPSDEVGKRFHVGRHLRADSQKVWHRADGGDRNEIYEGVVS